MRKGGEVLEVGKWWTTIADKARSGFMLRRFNFGRSGGHVLCVSPAIGTFAELSARDDILTMNGAQVVATDVGTWGSNWVVANGALVPDGPILGLGSPEGAIAAPKGAIYIRTDAGAGHALYYKASASGPTGWTTDALGAMVDTRDPTRDLGAPLDGSTLITTHLQASANAAKKAAVAGLGYGLGGEVRLQIGVGVTGPVGWSRWVSFYGSGPLGGTILRSSYTSLGSTPGVDALITMLDDGSGQSGIVGQQRISNLGIDGRRSTIENVGNPLRTHVRHGLHYPEPVDGTDRVCSVGDLQIMNMPGFAWVIEKNDQVRGGNLKFTGSRGGLKWSQVKDGKVDQIGVGSNGPGGSAGDSEEAANIFDNNASLKFGKVDFWTGGNSGARPLAVWKSCAKLVIGEGEIEGMWVFTGDNAEEASKAFRQNSVNTCQSLNFKVSEDLHAAYVAAGITANVETGAGYVGHVKLLDHSGLKLPNCSFCYKLGQPQDGEGNRLTSLPATPPVAIWIGTSVAPGDPNYADFLRACGDVDVTGASLTWWEGKDSPGGKRSRAVYGFREHICNHPYKLRGLRLGHVILRPTGTQQEDEVPLSGTLSQRTYTTAYDKGLLYLRLDPNWSSGNWASMRKLTDEDSVGLGYATFVVPDLSASAPAGFTYYMVYKQ
jgi:hypothetical protein